MKMKLTSLLILLFIWNLSSKFYDPIILPSFWDVSRSMIDILLKGDFYSSVFSSTMKLAVGLFFSVVVGFFLGWAMSLNKFMKELLHPLVLFLQSLPVISWILLALIWFDPNIIPVYILIINGVAIVSFSTYEGIKGVDSKLIEMARLYRVGKKKMLFDLYIPSITTNFIGALKSVLASSYKIVVMAEVIAKTDKGIGSKINWAWINIETSEILAWSIIVVIISYCLEKFVTMGMKKILGRFYV